MCTRGDLGGWTVRLITEQTFHLDRATRTQVDGDTRSKGQIMADTLVARLTGQAAAEKVGVEVGIPLPLGALIDDPDTHTVITPTGHQYVSNPPEPP